MKKILLSLLLAVTLIANVCCATEEVLEEFFAYGTVENISTSSISVIEYDDETDVEKTEVYSLGGEIEVIGADDIQSIEEGNSVEVGYILSNGEKVVTYIILDE